MERIIKLKMPIDTQSVSHGEQHFPVRDGTVEVPEGVAVMLLRSHPGMREISRQRDDEMVATPIFGGKRAKG